jgi:hypothetical protein
MDLSELEVTAGRILEEKKRLKSIEGELNHIETDLKSLPRRAEKEKRFYSLIGLHWEEPRQLMQRGEELRKEKDEILRAIAESHDKILKGFSSEELIVPLDPNLIRDGAHYVFRYRSGATFPKTLEELSDLLGLPSPLKINDVTIAADQIFVLESDPYLAEEKIVEAFDAIRKTVSLKLTPRQ